MNADPALVLAGLVLAHLVADFVLQSDRIVSDKAGPGGRAVRGLGLHALGVAVCLVPFVAVFGTPAVWLLVTVTASHVVVDRLKAVATRRAEARALAEVRSRHQPAGSSAVALGPAWTPAPAALFVADQLVHGAILVAAWLVWLSAATPLPEAASTIDRLLGTWDRAVVHEAALVTAVLASLAIVNVRAGAVFVAVLVHPRESVTGAALPDDRRSPSVAAQPGPRAWRLRAGPFEATAEPLAPERPDAPDPPGRGHASPARVGATIGIIERLLIATFVLTGNQAAIGFVVAAKTIARFRQLDDRDFAEYYLLGTLASVGVALVSALLAAAALGTLPR